VCQTFQARRPWCRSDRMMMTTMMVMRRLLSASRPPSGRSRHGWHPTCSTRGSSTISRRWTTATLRASRSHVTRPCRTAASRVSSDLVCTRCLATGCWWCTPRCIDPVAMRVSPPHTLYVPQYLPVSDGSSISIGEVGSIGTTHSDRGQLTYL